MDTTLPDPLVDRLLDGRYRIQARVAAGGMATVYRALDTRLDRVLAVKVMHPALAADKVFVERFIREAKSAARLDHPNVVSVYDQGTDGGYVYLAMEYVAGCTLRDVLRERGALQPRAALDIAEPVLAALGAAHRAGLVHRDMKPENVLIGDDGRVKVADFGLARTVGTNSATNTGSILGTVSYLAPEQIEHGTADTRTDVYACGVVLYEMLTGVKPHSGASPAQILYQHLHRDVPPPSQEVPGLAPELDDLVTVATARDPELRPSDAVGMLGLVRAARATLTREQLDARPPLAAGPAVAGDDEEATSVLPRPVTAQPLPPAEAPEPDPMDMTARFDGPPEPPPPPAPPARPRRFAALRRRPRRAVLVVAGVLLALLAGTGVWYINAGQFTSVPAVLDLTQAQAEKKLDKAGLKVRVQPEFSDTVERGHVMSTDPKPGERIRNTGRVTVVVSRGPERAEVPNVVGMRLDDAKKRITQAGLTVGDVRTQFSDETPQGEVLSSDPRGGDERRPDSPVSLIVSKGEPVEVPDVSGLSPDDAQSTLSDAGLRIRVSDAQVYSDREKGDVAEQSPARGVQVAKGDTVTVTLSKGKEMLTVPDVTGRSEADAKRILTSAGFQVRVDRPFFFPKDSVESQSVRAGDKAARGDTVTIRLKGAL
ncbi:Stk1 family PASTA domain-containing Ser/Thr kinase [Streptomyces mobaraensis]|uniref:non-specific serine/threonine protein kinase n=1 Tax=Streptomyces mobaraensis (strain ATCC 29032 / DSM 40847 / JCM 4168 / NBRC 13819 / NCIMB 11159 / IPCR 16-22) TaxID=1223523 RepID=M3A2K5_STRM1|nr:Stk1 family PASTA domain-containing Ser/Thr kinase [Streptomyces mobaraensis]EME99338.1 serine/threonine protein kinase [Streptomyces mobaraensis NBRC 13819 = DSM 40847]